MRLDYTTSSFIILGGWNPNIVNEQWIRKNLLDRQDEQLEIGINIGVHGPIIEAVFRNVRLTIIGQRLELNLRHSNNFTRIEDCVRKLCECQSDTQVTGYGVNFDYVDNSKIHNNLRSIFAQSNITQQVLNESHAYSIFLDGIITNINIDIKTLENKSGLKFNFHFNIDSVSTLIQRMTEHPIKSLNNKALEFASNQYGLRLEN